MPQLQLMVYFQSDLSVRGAIDPGFGVPVSWDVPILEGYPHRFLRRNADMSRPFSVRLSDPDKLIREDGLDAVRMIVQNAHPFLERNGILVVEVGHNRAAIENAFPTLPFVWLDTPSSSGAVFLMQRDDLPD